jgi:hypothetical protein
MRGREDDKDNDGDDCRCFVVVVVVVVVVVTNDWVCTLTCTHKVPLPEP